MQLSEKIKELTLDRTNGASQLARKALEVLEFFAKTSKNKTYKGFMEDFRDIGRRLVEARPNMAPVHNLVAQTIYEVNSLKEEELVTVRKFAVSRIDELCRKSENSVKQAAEYGAKFVANKCFIASCSFSSTVCEAFNFAKQQGKCFKVFVAESRNENEKISYGQKLAEFLESIKVPVKVFSDNEIYRYVPRMEFVLVGADSIVCDGSIINGTPTYEIAVKAREHNVPLYSICETLKMNVLSCLGRTVELKKGFDLVPSNLVTGIITEQGVLDATKIAEIVEERTKFFEIFNIS